MAWVESAHLVATLFMTGLIWFVQVVHYPLMARVGQRSFVEYERAHTRRTGWVVAPPMLVELATGIALFASAEVEIRLLSGVALGLLVAIWALTALVQVPQHRQLSASYNADLQRRLVLWNWPRVLLWSARSLLVVGWL